MKEVEPEGYSPLTLAYIGDSIYDLIIKTKVISEGNKQVKKLHQETSSMVQASAQSEMMRALQPLLTEEEHAVYRRGQEMLNQYQAGKEPVTDRLPTCDRIWSVDGMALPEKRMEKNGRSDQDRSGSLKRMRRRKEAGEIEMEEKKMNSQQIEGEMQ